MSEPVEVSLCTGRQYGNYQRVGEAIRKRLEPRKLAVRIVATEGSVDNLERIRGGTCDAGIVQHDVYLRELYRNDGIRTARLGQRPKYLFDDFVHLVCNRRAGVERLDEILEQPERRWMLIGEPGSGSAATWETLVWLDDRFRRVSTDHIGGEAALSVLEANEQPTCMFYVASLDTPLMRRANDRGDALTLIAVGDEE